jgi:hypothetical protein
MHGSSGWSGSVRSYGASGHSSKSQRGNVIRTLLAAAVILLSGAAYGQTPYAGMQDRAIKALSEQQVADLGAGRGMGLALAAELNDYPGPSHVAQS